jgi:hypothetical protein
MPVSACRFPLDFPLSRLYSQTALGRFLSLSVRVMSPRSSTSGSLPAPRRPPGEERLFAAGDGRLWGASIRQGTGGSRSAVLVFTGLSEARQAVHAVAIEAGLRLRDLSDEDLRGWLAIAPRVEKLV